MRMQSRRIAALLLAVLVSVPLFASDNYPKLFVEGMRDKKIPGAAYAIVKNGEVTQLNTFGIRAKGQKAKVNEDTVFRLASVSKTFSASLAGLLVRDGALSWDTKVSPFVPAFQLKKRGHAEALELRHLLSHTVGLMPNSYDNMIEDGWDIPKIVPWFRRLDPMCGPGRCYGYQNVAFSLMEPMIEQTTERQFEELIEERLLKPLDMRTASVGMAGYINAENKALPHRNTRRGWVRTKVKPNYYNVAPAAGVNASINDMIVWLKAHMGYAPNVLPEDVLAALREKQVRTKRELYKRQWRSYLTDAHYGYGWRIYDFNGHEVVMHAGGVAGFRSIISYSTELDVGHVMLMNAESRVIDDLTAQFWDQQFTQLMAQERRVNAR